MFFTNVDSALHTLAGRSGILDALVEAVPQTGLYVARVLALILLWPRREALRAGLAAASGAVLALGGGALLGLLWNRPRPFADGQYTPPIATSASWWLLGRVAASLDRLEGWADPLPFRPPSRASRQQPEPVTR